MGNVIQFPARPRVSKAGPSPADPVAGVALAMAAGSDWHDLVRAAQPLLALLRDSDGLIVMLQGLPRDRDILASALATLLRAVRLVESVYGRHRAVTPTAVYLGRSALEWFDDGFGEDSALAVPLQIEPERLAEALIRRHAAR